MMFEEFRASDEVLAARHALAGLVRDAFDVAGIPHHLEDDYPRPAGAEVEIDPGNDEMGGVLVHWRPSAPLITAVMESTRDGGTDPAAERLYVAFTAAMRDAMVAVLRASGFEVVPIDDGYHRPPTLQVLAEPRSS